MGRKKDAQGIAIAHTHHFEAAGVGKIGAGVDVVIDAGERFANPISEVKNSDFTAGKNSKKVLKYPLDLGEITQLSQTRATMMDDADAGGAYAELEADIADGLVESYDFPGSASELSDLANSNSHKSPINYSGSKPFVTFNFMTISVKAEDIGHSSVSSDLSDAVISVGLSQGVGNVAQSAAGLLEAGSALLGGTSRKVVRGLGIGINAAGTATKGVGAYLAYKKVKGAWKTAKKNMSLEKNPNRDSRQMVALYMPPGIAIEDSAEYEDNSRAVLAAAQQAIQTKGFSNEDQMVVKAGLFGQALMGGGVLSAAGGTMGMPTAGVTAGIGEFIHLTGDEDMRILGRALNPNEYKQFKSTNIRSFSMTFKFLPDSPAESREVEEIIRHFRAGLYPIKKSAVTLVVPDMLSIEFFNTSGMVKMPMSYLTNVGVTYNPNSASFFKVDGKPVEISMAISLTEIAPIHREDVLLKGM